MTESLREDVVSTRPAWLLPVTVALVAAFFMQGTRGLYESTEGRYAECAREMARGNLLEPMLNGEHHWTKPPLTYWAIGAGTVVLGRNPWGVRLYLVVAFVLTVLAVYVLEGALWDGRAKGYAALIYATSPIAIASAQAVSTDGLLALWEAWALACYWLAVRGQGTRRKVYVILFWGALGMAFATKGPVGLLPLLGVLPTHYYLRRRGESRPGLWCPGGLALFFILGLWWYVLMVLRHPELLRYWFVGEMVDRVLTDTHDRNSEPIKIVTMYLPIILFGTGPWLWWVLYKLRRALRWQRFRTLCTDAREGAPCFFLAVSFGVPLVLFCLSQSRMPLYLVPLFVPMALGIGRALEWLAARAAVNPRNVFRVGLAMLLLGCVVKGVMAQKITWKDMTSLARLVREAPDYGPDTQLAALYGEPLNGLEFHLDRRIPTFELAAGDPRALLERLQTQGGFPDLLPAANAGLVVAEGAARVSLPQGTLVVLRRPDFQKYAPAFPQKVWQLVTQDEKWTLLRTVTPLETTVRQEDAAG